VQEGSSWPWSYGSWIYNYLCSQCLSSLMLWVRLPQRARCTTLCDKVCQWLAAGRWYSLGTPVSSTNETDRNDIAEILLKVALNTINQAKPLCKYGSGIYNYMCNQCLSPLKLWVRTPFMARCTRYNIMWQSLSVIYGRLVVFSGHSGFLHQWNWPQRYNWNIVESDVKHHK
jgi:hypothetical protein